MGHPQIQHRDGAEHRLYPDIPAFWSKAGAPFLEMEPQLHALASRRDKVRAAEGGEEVVQGHFVREIDHSETQAPPLMLAAEKVVVSHSDIE